MMSYDSYYNVQKPLIKFSFIEIEGNTDIPGQTADTSGNSQSSYKSILPCTSHSKEKTLLKSQSSPGLCSQTLTVTCWRHSARVLQLPQLLQLDPSLLEVPCSERQCNHPADANGQRSSPPPSLLAVGSEFLNGMHTKPPIHFYNLKLHQVT